MDYYNTVRTHLSLAKDAPILRPVHAIDASKRGPSSAACIINISGFD
jgi:hypothetical protein